MISASACTMWRARRRASERGRSKMMWWCARRTTNCAPIVMARCGSVNWMMKKRSRRPDAPTLLDGGAPRPEGRVFLCSGSQLQPTGGRATSHISRLPARRSTAKSISTHDFISHCPAGTCMLMSAQFSSEAAHSPDVNFGCRFTPARRIAKLGGWRVPKCDLGGTLHRFASRPPRFLEVPCRPPMDRPTERPMDRR